MNEDDFENQDALAYAMGHKEFYEKKSNKNKLRLNWLMLVVIVASASTPIFILISDEFIISKLIPSILGAAAAFSSYWIQFKKPHDKWVLYRSAQRQIEHAINSYKFNLLDKTDSDNEKSLVRVINNLNLEIHQKWVPLVPNYEEISKKLSQ